MKSFLSLACALLVACAPALGAEKPSPPAHQALTADTPLTTAQGNSFVAPAGWSVRTAGVAVILTAPEGGSHIAIVDVVANDADAAVASGWAAYDAKANWPLKLASDRPSRDGWLQIRGYQYETSANDKRSVSARALKRGDGWTVTIYDMADAVGEKRDAQVELILGRLLPKGYSRESFAGKAAHKLDAARIDALTQFVEDARQQFGVPGMAIGIVQDGNVAYAEGFGVRELGKPDKVDADTRFMIASNTKALTTLMLAKLVEAGKFSWETPVTQVLPTFRLGNADTTAQVKMKHLVCACTGLPRQDMEWMFASEDASPDSVMATVATMQPTSGFGELYQYSNLLAAAAGYVGGHAAHPQQELGAAYDAAMQSLVFDPLGMTSTTLDFARAQRGNHAAPHGQDVDGKTVPASMDLNYADIPNRPNGGVWSNVNDMLRYVQMELDKGLLPDGTRYIGEAPLLARREQQVARGSDTGYGMGLKLDRSSGTLLVNHGGSAFGFISDMLWLPEHNVGAVILTNDDVGGIYVRSLFRRRFLEVLFDGRPEAVESLAVQARRMKEDVAAERKSLAVPADPLLVSKLAARYRSAELGGIDVLRKGSATWFDFGDWKSEVASRQNGDGTVSFVTISPSEGGYEFIVTAAQDARSLVLRDAQHEYVFAEAK
ncbi:CubicO group peptidase (beta-lactamase class C family) [Lysobacter niastensis]|uniref:CubicO group peptidase (Beta-lactamase class C family) n=1 Tax=Lysobacter niastensis TaxID=380629 RepID=A0ABU1WBJ9_9GAMM|nr:serine hydrolase domain-containing protein [Lysobacter niastensis]MDR7134710.1 CubicO group peptidase (beta-lactamase class C family) [Lysobacter niastensis]